MTATMTNVFLRLTPGAVVLHGAHGHAIGSVARDPGTGKWILRDITGQQVGSALTFTAAVALGGMMVDPRSRVQSVGDRLVTAP